MVYVPVRPLRAFSERAGLAGVIDFQPADGGSYRTQDGWIPFFNAIGQRMISPLDAYLAGKNGNDELIARFKKDFAEFWLMTSGRNFYNGTSLDARIVHNHGSTVVKPTERRVLVPFYREERLDKILGTNEGTAYMQGQLNTPDGPDVIGEALSRLSGYKVDDIRVWTPDQKSRAARPERAVVFSSGGREFLVLGISWASGGIGLSHGVSAESAKPMRKKSA